MAEKRKGSDAAGDGGNRDYRYVYRYLSKEYGFTPDLVSSLGYSQLVMYLEEDLAHSSADGWKDVGSFDAMRREIEHAT